MQHSALKLNKLKEARKRRRGGFETWKIFWIFVGRIVDWFFKNINNYLLCTTITIRQSTSALSADTSMILKRVIQARVFTREHHSTSFLQVGNVQNARCRRKCSRQWSSKNRAYFSYWKCSVFRLQNCELISKTQHNGLFLRVSSLRPPTDHLCSSHSVQAAVIYCSDVILQGGNPDDFVPLANPDVKDAAVIG